MLAEDYENLYKLEQRHELGKAFLFWLDKGLASKSFRKDNPNFDVEKFRSTVVKLGKEYPETVGREMGYRFSLEYGNNLTKEECVKIAKEYEWFTDEVDYSLDLDK